MKLSGINFTWGIWGLALGYFVFYVPYAASTKMLSSGLWPGHEKVITGFSLLPAVDLGIMVMLVVLMSLMGWWKYARSVKIFGFPLPIATNRWTLFSGLATAFIIMTTTLAYSFTGISLVFAALLMRGGVLILSPVTDLLHQRKVHWYSWIALGLSLLALMLIFMEKGGYQLTVLAALNIGFYLSGYIFRLQFMTYFAKTNSKTAKYRFFVEEMLVAMAAIILIPLILAAIGQGQIMLDLRAGFRDLFTGNYLIPALIIGALYACLYIFGSRIYLDHRENTFCIPVNRTASLLAGVAASMLLTFLFGKLFYSDTQLISAGILLIAICFLCIPEWKAYRQIRTADDFGSPKLYIFVCPGNTGRSPMAQAICWHKVKLALQKQDLNPVRSGLKITSAGINANEGMTMLQDARAVLSEMEIPFPEHRASTLTADQVHQAERIWCMSESQRIELIGKFPGATFKTTCLDPEDNIPKPYGKGKNAYRTYADKINFLINRLFEDKKLELA